jgi:hypothetical protein
MKADAIKAVDNWMYNKDLILFYIDALAMNTKIYNGIDQLYKTNERVFSRYAKKSAYYNHPLIVGGDLNREIYGKKVLGIILYINKTNNEETIACVDKLIEKGWSRAYKHIIESDRSAADVYVDELKNGLTNNVMGNAAEMFIFCSLCVRFRATIIRGTDFKNFLLSISYRANAFHQTGNWHYSFYNTADASIREKAKLLRSRIFQDCKLDLTVDGQMLFTDDRLSAVHKFLFQLIYSDKMVLYYIFRDAQLSKHDIDDILCNYLSAVGDCSDEDAIKMLIPGIVAKLLARTVTQLKAQFFAHPNDVSAALQEDKIAGLTADNKRMDAEVIRLRKQVSSLEDKLLSTKQEADREHIGRIRELEAEVSKLRERIDQEREKDRELVALRDFFFSTEQHEKELANTHTSTSIMDLTDTAGAIVGGHPKWSTKMKELLPKWVFISSVGFDKRSLSGIQTICFLPNHMSHKLYYKAIAIAKSKKMDIGYIYSQNEQLALKEIAKALAKSQD